MTKWLTFAAAALAVALLALAGPGTRLGIWTFRGGFTLLRWSAWIGLAAAAAGLVQLLLPAVRRGGWLPYAAAALAGALALAIPALWLREARRVPPINDITTDTAEPPAFVAVLPLRAGAPTPATYPGPATAQAQQRAYPDLGPLLLAADPAAAFAGALAAARAMGWEIVAADAAAGRIEATDTTRWFAFKDDIVVRVRPEGAGSRVDVRSVSRVGKSDIGTNARRIRRFLAALGKAPQVAGGPR
jgi:uncharacterized protein (DUF1499 family)